MKEFFKSKKFQHILIGIGAVLAVLIVFEAGMLAGYHKAFFSYRMGEDYYRTFDNDSGNPPNMPALNDHDLPNQNGAVGKIVKVSLPTLTVADKDGVEKTVLIDSDTVIRHLRDTITSNDLMLGDYIIVIGNPNAQSQIDAKLIRVLPPPSSPAPASAPTVTSPVTQ